MKTAAIFAAALFVAPSAHAQIIGLTCTPSTQSGSSVLDWYEGHMVPEATLIRDAVAADVVPLLNSAPLNWIINTRGGVATAFGENTASITYRGRGEGQWQGDHNDGYASRSFDWDGRFLRLVKRPSASVVTRWKQRTGRNMPATQTEIFQCRSTDFR